MQSNRRGNQIRYSICVSGAAGGGTVETAHELAEGLGAAIARAGHIITTGATIGLPYIAARGAKQANGMSVGFSPAVNFREHVRKYRLPHDAFDFINFTGLHYVGRDLYLIQSSDAVITVGGRVGSLHEFTSALEAHKPCGVLLGSGGTADLIPEIVTQLDPSFQRLVIYERDPEQLVTKIIKVLEEKNSDLDDQLDYNQEWFLHPGNRLG